MDQVDEEVHQPRQSMGEEDIHNSPSAASYYLRSRRIQAQDFQDHTDRIPLFSDIDEDAETLVKKPFLLADMVEEPRSRKLFTVPGTARNNLGRDGTLPRSISEVLAQSPGLVPESGDGCSLHLHERKEGEDILKKTEDKIEQMNFNKEREDRITKLMESVLDKMDEVDDRLEGLEQKNQRKVMNFNNPPIKISTQPPQFDGSNDWRSFYIQFENCAKIANWSSETKVYMLGCCLTKSAQRFHSQLPEEDRTNYGKLMDILSRRYGDDPPETYQALLAGRTRKPKETVHELKDDLWRLVGRAHPGLPYDVQERLTLQAFNASLDLDSRLHLLGKNVKTLDDAASALIMYEAVVKAKDKNKKKSDHDPKVYAVASVEPNLGKKNKPKFVEKDASTNSKYKGSEDRLLSLMEKIEGHLAKGSNRNPNGQKKGTCYSCGEEGHFSNQCPQKTKKIIRCYRCQAEGHIATNCSQVFDTSGN